MATTQQSGLQTKIAGQQTRAARLKEIQTLAATDPEAAQVQLDALAAEQQAQLGTLGVSTADELNALIAQTQQQISDSSKEVTTLGLDIEQAEAVLAELESQQASGASEQATALALAGSSKLQLQALINNLKARRDAAQAILDSSAIKAAIAVGVDFSAPIADVTSLSTAIAELESALTSNEVNLAAVTQTAQAATTLANEKLIGTQVKIATTVKASATAVASTDKKNATAAAADLQAIKDKVGEVVLVLQSTTTTTTLAPTTTVAASTTAAASTTVAATTTVAVTTTAAATTTVAATTILAPTTTTTLAVTTTTTTTSPPTTAAPASP